MALAQAAYRFGYNSGTEANHPFIAALSTPIDWSENSSATFILRVLVQATGAGQSNVDFQLQYSKNGGAFTDVTAASSNIRAVTTTVFTDAANSTSRLGGTGTFETSSSGCSHDGLCGGANFDIVTDGRGECVYSLAFQTADTAAGDTFTFRLLADGATFTYSVTPTINVVAGPVQRIRTLIAGGGGDYTTLTSWEAGEQRDLVSHDEIDVIECQTGTVSESFFVGGSTTDSTRYRLIRAATGHEHGGDFSAGFISTSNTTTIGSIKPFDDHLRIDGIVIKSGSETSGGLISIGGGTSCPELRVSNCLLDGQGTGTANGIVRTVGAASDYFWNNVVRGVSAECIFCNQASTTFVVYNNTCVGGTYGVRQLNGTVHLKNNIAQGNSTACYNGTFSTSATNISSDATSPESGLRNIDLDFVNEAGLDYHLASTDTEAIGAGTDLSADGNLAFSTDFEGDSRPAGSWDIGADERLAVGALIFPPLPPAVINLLMR